MKVLFSLDNYDRGAGGAEMDAQGFARGLAERGNTVEVLQSGPADDSYDDGRIRVHTRHLRQPWLRLRREAKFQWWNDAWDPILCDFLQTSRPDLVLTQQALIRSSVEATRDHGVPVVAMVQAYSHFCPQEFEGRDPLEDCTLACEECLSAARRGNNTSVRHMERSRRALVEASLVVANSRYVQRVVARQAGIDAFVVHPPIDLDAYPPRRGAHDSVLFIKPQRVKGLAIVTRIAKRIPSTKFIVAGRAGSRARWTLGSLPNVTLLGWVSDMASVYARTSVVLGPSIWPEPFGRVFAEAGAAGIPSVASNRGGIPEAAASQELLVDDIQDIDAWIAALDRAQDPTRRAGFIEKARRRAAGLSVATACEQLATGVRHATGLAL